MKKNKLILFDWGGIVESHTKNYSCPKAWMDIFSKCGSDKKLNSLSDLSKYNLSSITNEKDLNIAFNKIKHDYNFKVSFEEFKQIHRDITSKIDYFKEVVDFEISLKDKCYIGLLSNLTILDKERIDKQLGLKSFDYVFLSCDLGLSKPNEEIFKKVIDEVPFSSDDILFIDDNKVNIDASIKANITSIKATGEDLDYLKKVCNNFLNI